MLSWEETLVNLTNCHDHELECHHQKELHGVQFSSAGRYTIILSRKAREQVTNDQIVEQIKEEYGLQDEELQIEAYPMPAGADQTSYVISILEKAQIKVQGLIGQFREEAGLGEIEGYRRIVNDGNTIIFHFWDALHHFVLLHEIKY